MQLCSVDATTFKKKFLFRPWKHEKKNATKVAHNLPKFFFQYCQPAQNLPKSHILFHKNGSLRDFCIIDFAW